jgi:hypothetical protein
MSEPEGHKSTTGLRAFARGRIHILVEAVRDASSEELVRGFVALILVIVLLLLVIEPPSGKPELVASSKTLAIAVIAFYFGLHKATPLHGERGSGGRELEGGTGA